MTVIIEADACRGCSVVNPKSCPQAVGVVEQIGYVTGTRQAKGRPLYREELEQMAQAAENLAPSCLLGGEELQNAALQVRQAIPLAPDVPRTEDTP